MPRPSLFLRLRLRLRPLLRPAPLCVVIALLVLAGHLALRPPFPPVTAARAAAVRALRFGMFLCWSLSTFSGKEWTKGVTDLSLFAPTGFDPDDWARTAREAEMKYLLLLVKHHDGFCLWDTDTTARKVTRTKLGTDVLAAVRRAATAQGLRLAIYYSEGDWTWPDARDPARKRAQLRELLTRYGPIEFFWLDPAIGDGGLDHKETTRFIKALQPSCMVGFGKGPAGGDLRLGEYGHPAPLWDPAGAGYGHSDARGYRHYQAAEFAFPLFDHRSHRWFYTEPAWDHLARPAEQIYQVYRRALLHDNLFDLAVAPDRRGRLRDIDRERLRTVGRLIRGERPAPPPG